MFSRALRGDMIIYSSSRRDTNLRAHRANVGSRWAFCGKIRDDAACVCARYLGMMGFQPAAMI